MIQHTSACGPPGLPELSRGPGMPEPIWEILQRTVGSGVWKPADVETLQAFFLEHDEEKHAKPEKLAAMLGWFALGAEAGDRLLGALRAYYEVFFAEEENRIRPALQDALGRAPQRAGTLAPLELVEQLSEGVRLDEGFET